MLRAPDTSDATRASAQRIRDAFIPARSTLADSHAEEAAAAKKNRPRLAEIAADLKAFPLPGGKTLHDWTKSFLDAGDTPPYPGNLLTSSAPFAGRPSSGPMHSSANARHAASSETCTPCSASRCNTSSITRP